MAESVQFKPYASNVVNTASALQVTAKFICGAHNLNAAAAQTATVTITDAASGAVLAVVPALAIGALWNPPLTGITVPSGSFIATPSAGPSGAGIAIFSQQVG
jgi:hypothetical protein